MNYSVSELGGFAGQGLVGYTKELIKKRETNKALLDMGKDTDADGNPLSKDPLGGVENFLVGMYESMCGGLGRLRDGINYIGEHVSNLGKDIWRGHGLIWESDIERANRIVDMYTAQQYDAGDDAVSAGSQSAQNEPSSLGEEYNGKKLDQILKESGHKELTNQKSAVTKDAPSVEEAEKVVYGENGEYKYGQGPGGGAAQIILGIMRTPKGGLDDKIADMNDALKALESEKKKLTAGGISLNGNYSKTVEQLNAKLQRAQDVVSIMTATKQYFEISSNGITDANKQKTNAVASQLCCVISMYLLRSTYGYEKRPMGEVYMSELDKGRIMKGSTAPYLYDHSQIRESRSSTDTEPKIEQFSSTNAGGYGGYNEEQQWAAQKLLEKNSADFAVIYADTDSPYDPNGDLANHFFMIYKNKEDGRWYQMDHNNKNSMNYEVDWNKVARTYYYKNNKKVK
ncbi:MAG: hypothetical protein KBH06_01730 [Spirochaetes bacterium]|nr:hypothetical protein [Spirochaetota bacterium]